MKKLALFLFGLGSLVAVSINSYASNQEPQAQEPVCAPVVCPTDTVCGPEVCPAVPCVTDTVCDPAAPCTLPAPLPAQTVTPGCC